MELEMSWCVHKKDFVPQQGRLTLWLPEGSKILSVKNQYERLTIWYTTVHQTSVTEERELLVLHTATTPDIPQDKLEFLDTVLFADGTYVLHVFEVKG